MNKLTLKLTRAGIIASLYCVLSLLTLPVSGGAIQFRVSEGLTLLPLLFAESIPALFVGCLIFNFLSGLAIYDVILGSLITLASAVLTFFVGKIIKQQSIKIIIGGVFPVLFNAFGLPIIWLFLGDGLQYAYQIQVVFLLVSQAVSIYLFGSLIYLYLVKLQSKGVKYFL